jgi:hypothetical protein
VATYRSIMFTDGCVDDAAVEEDLGSVCNGVEYPQGFFELLIVVVTQRLDPSLDFLSEISISGSVHVAVRRTCLSDMASRRA